MVNELLNDEIHSTSPNAKFPATIMCGQSAERLGDLLVREQ